MKIFLASFFDPESHGPGRKIGICPDKPRQIDYETNGVFEHLSPEQIYYDYHKNKKKDPEEAGKIFEKEFRQKLTQFKNTVEQKAKAQNKTIEEVMPFEDGDTLLSWERNGHLTFRSIVAEYLREMGYDVEECQ